MLDLDSLIFKSKNPNLLWQYNNARKCICCNISNKNVCLDHINYDNVIHAYVQNNFLNIQLKKDCLLQILNSEYLQNRKIHIEHTSANPVGRLHIGNIRIAYIGDTLKRLNLYKGNYVTTEYYINDLGNACAASLMCYLKHPELELDQLYLYYSLNKSEFDAETLKELVYNIETSDKYKEILEKITQFNLNLILSDLNKLNIYFDQFVFESTLKQHTHNLIEQIKNKFTVEENLIYYKSNNNTKDIIRRTNGSYTYIARDIVHTVQKLEKNYDEYYTVVGQDHQLFKTNFLNLLTYISDKETSNFKIIVVKFIKTQSEKMSKRKNNLIFLDSIFDINSFKLLLASTDKELQINNLNVSEYIIKLNKIQQSMIFHTFTHINLDKILSILINFKLRLKIIEIKQIYRCFTSLIDEIYYSKISKQYYQKNEKYFILIEKYLKDFKYILGLL